jgi:hypothetical protein
VPPRPCRQRKMPLSLLPMCTTVACTAAVSTSQPSCVQLPPSTPCRLATSPFRTRKKFLHAYTTQYRASQCQASRPQEFVRIGPSVYGLWLLCLLPFRRPGGSTPTALDFHPQRWPACSSASRCSQASMEPYACRPQRRIRHYAAECSSKPVEFVRVGPSEYGSWLSCLLPFR